MISLLIGIYLIIGAYLIFSIHMSVLNGGQDLVKPSGDILVVKYKTRKFEYFISMFIAILIWLPLMIFSKHL